MSHRLVVPMLVLLEACGASPAPLAPASTAPASSVPEAAPHAAAAPPSAGAGVSAPAGAQPGLPPPTFHVVNETAASLSLLEASGGVTIAAAGPIFSKLSDAGIEQDETFGKGLPLSVFSPITGVAGQFPDGLWATAIQSNGRTGWGELYRRGKQGWSRVGGALPQTRVYIGIGDWSAGRVLALQGSLMAPTPPPQFSFQLVSGAATPLPILTKPPAGLAGDAAAQCAHWGTWVVPEQLATLPSGEVMVSGSNCAQDGYAVERWAPGQTRGALHNFVDSAEIWSAKLILRAGRGAALVANLRKHKPRLLLPAGETWSSEELDVEGTVNDADMTEDGTLFFVTQAFDDAKREWQPGRLWWRPPGQARASEVPVPARAAPESWPANFVGVTAVSATSKEDVWLVAGDALLHSRPPPSAPKKIAWAESQQFPGSLRLPKAASSGCEQVFVLLYGITKSTPPNYDFPLTRKALAGHPELEGTTLAETEDNGKRFFGAFVKSFAQGQRLAKLVQENVPGSIPAVLCAAPQRVREIAIDWKTGALR